jgi:hypothetical protein
LFELRGLAKSLLRLSTPRIQRKLDVLSPDSNDVHDADMREGAGGGPFVDRSWADAEELGDLADGQNLLD